MPPITAILHTCNDGLRLGRALQTLHACDEILVIDHGSTDQTLEVARQYSATIRRTGPDQAAHDQILVARNPWLLSMLPSESLSEGLEAAMFEWKLCEEHEVAGIKACSVLLREETGDGWSQPRTTTRIIPRTWNQWEGKLPRHDPASKPLAEDMLRFRLP